MNKAARYAWKVVIWSSLLAISYCSKGSIRIWTKKHLLGLMYLKPSKNPCAGPDNASWVFLCDSCYHGIFNGKEGNHGLLIFRKGLVIPKVLLQSATWPTCSAWLRTSNWPLLAATWRTELPACSWSKKEGMNNIPGIKNYKPGDETGAGAFLGWFGTLRPTFYQ